MIASVVGALSLLMTLLVVGLVRGQVNVSGNVLVPEAQRSDAGPLVLPLLSDGPLGKAGTDIDLAKFRGRPVILNFWASWCTGCREESDTLNALAVSAGKQGVVTLGVNTRDVRDYAVAFAREQKMPFASVRDRSNEVSDRYSVAKYPETFVIDRKGRIAAHILGPINDPQLGALVVNAVEAVL